MSRGERVLAGMLLVFGGAIAVQALRTKRQAAVAPAARQRTGDDSSYNVPLRHTAAERMKRAVERAAQVRTLIAASAGGTFIEEVLDQNDSTVRHWASSGGAPVAVWVQVPATLAGHRAAHGALVRQAFETWSSADGVPVRFAMSDDSAQASVHVVWTTSFADQRIGLTRIDAVNDTIRTSTITIATLRGDGTALGEADIARCALHEVGHLLGLAHTADSTSIMAAESARPQLSPRDRATIRLLYALPVGSIKAGAIW